MVQFGCCAMWWKEPSDMIFSAAFKMCLPDGVAQVSQICLESATVGGCGQKGGSCSCSCSLPLCSSPNPFAGPSLIYESTQREYWKEQDFCSGMEGGCNQETQRTASYPINIPALHWRTDVTQLSHTHSLSFQPRLSSNITAPGTDSRRLRDGLAVQIKPDSPSQCEPANEGRPRDCSCPTSREAVPSRHTLHTTLLHTSHRPRL